MSTFPVDPRAAHRGDRIRAAFDGEQPIAPPRRLRVRGFQVRPSIARLLRAIDRRRPALVRYQHAMAMRTR